jgi:hypothetical protein
MDRVQFIAGASGELGVQSQYLDGELHLVDHSLAGAVARAEKLQVLDVVIRPDAVDVMDGFFGEQIAPEMFGHDVSVFHDGMLFSGDQTGHRYPNVAVSFYVPTKVSAFEFCQSARALVFRLALLIAVFLLRVETTSRFAAKAVFFAAFYAGKCVLGFRGSFSAGARALHRTVQRVASEFLFVRRDVGLHHNERLAAFLAGKVDRGSTGGWQRQNRPVVTAARQATVFAAGFGVARVTIERVITVLAGHLDRHFYAPVFGNAGTVAVSLGMVK